MLVVKSQLIAMSTFFRRYGRPMLYGVMASSALYILYRIYKKSRNNDEDLMALEYRRRRVEKLVELRDKLVCVGSVICVTSFTTI